MIDFLRKRFASLPAAEGGSVIIMVSLSLVMLITAVGIAVDVAREQTLDARMQSALDAAGLAAGATANSPPATLPAYCATLQQATWVGCEAQRYFTANFPTGYLESGATPPAVTATVNPDQTVSLSVHTPQYTTFLNAVGINSVNVSANSTVTLAAAEGTELALVLDNTNSMTSLPPQGGGLTKIQELQKAITGSGGLLDILYGSSSPYTAKSNLFISVVPFADFVNVATAKSNLPSGCLMARSTYTASVLDPATFPGSTSNAGGMDISEDAPGTGAAAFTAYSHPLTSNTGLYEWGAGASVLINSSNTNINCTNAILPLTSDGNAVATTVSHLTATGSTFLDAGLAWGWRVLSPQWQNAWSGSTSTYIDSSGQSNTLPLPYKTSHMQKVVIFMTDGMNDWNCPANSGATVRDLYAPNADYSGVPRACGEYGQYGNVAGGTAGVYTDAFGNEIASGFNVLPQSYFPGFSTDAVYPSSQWLNDAQTYALAAEAQLDTLSQNVCNAMKAKGILIYTIGFGAPLGSSPPNYPPPYSSPTSQSDRDIDVNLDVPLLQACSSTPNVTCGTAGSDCFIAPSNAALSTAFQTIGNQISQLRVSQ